MNAWEAATHWVLGVTVAALIAYDVLAVWRGGVTATISHRILELSRRRPVLPFAFGVLCGHLLWPQG